jgi:hypothetical protein
MKVQGEVSKDAAVLLKGDLSMPPSFSHKAHKNRDMGVPIWDLSNVS